MKKLLFITLLALSASKAFAASPADQYQSIRADIVKLGQSTINIPKLQPDIAAALSIADQQVSQGQNSGLAYWGATQYLYGFRDGVTDTLETLP